jgi:hypothetical protein
MENIPLMRVTYLVHNIVRGVTTNVEVNGGVMAHVKVQGKLFQARKPMEVGKCKFEEHPD